MSDFGDCIVLLFISTFKKRLTSSFEYSYTRYGRIFNFMMIMLAEASSLSLEYQSGQSFVDNDDDSVIEISWP